MKSENYDGSTRRHKEDEPTQWSFSGSLLYCVTLVTTIGELEFGMMDWFMNNMFQDMGTLHQKLTGAR